jgi:hypothetical protein
LSAKAVTAIYTVKSVPGMGARDPPKCAWVTGLTTL